jgi:hypothetical protein
MIEDVIDAIESSIADVNKKFNGVCTARVINPIDPLFLGRVQVQLPSIDALDLQPWARIAVPMAGMLHGHYFMPNPMDEVLVAFEHGDTSCPYIIGSLWTALAPPPMPSPLTQMRAIRTLAGNQLVMSELPPTVTIQNGPTPPPIAPPLPSPVGPYSTVQLGVDGITAATPTMIKLQVGTTSVIISAAGIVMTVGGTSVGLTPGSVNITSGGPVTIAGSGPVTVVGAPIKLNC